MTRDPGSPAPPPARGRRRRAGYSEQLDEAPKLLESEPTDVEESNPADDKSPPLFEE
jgi:hypothetical protein